MAQGDDDSSGRGGLRLARERAIEVLSDRFAHDDLDVDEFEQRLTEAHRATSVEALQKLLGDLHGAGEAMVPVAPAGAEQAALVPAKAAAAIVPASSVRERGKMMALLGGVNRGGAWTVPRRLDVTAVMGGVMLDFREARLAPGVSEVHVTAVMGGVVIVVPPGLSVEVEGTAVMGGFDYMERAAPEPDPERPLLRVLGTAVMGGVSVMTRLPGESIEDEHYRRHREHHEQRRLAREERRRLRHGLAPRALPARGESDR